MTILLAKSRNARGTIASTDPEAIESELTGSDRSNWSEFRESWRILCAGTVGLPLCLMPGSAIGVFISPLSNAFGWSLASISGVATVMGLGAIIAGPIEGRLNDRFGFRPIVLAGIPLLAAAVAATSLIGQDILTLYLVMFLWASFSANSVSNYVRAVSGCFKIGRGKAIGLMFTAGGVGCAIGPRLAQWTIDQYGWRVGYLALAALVLLAWPLAYLWLTESRVVKKNALPEAIRLEEGYSRREVLRTSVFWYISGAWVISGLASGGYFYLVPFLNEVGMSRENAAGCLSIMFAASAVVHPLLGYLNDRWYPPFVAAFAFLLEAAAFAMLALFGGEQAVLAAVFAGVGMSGLSNSLYNCLPRYFGLRCFGEIAGLIQSACSAAGMLGPFLFSVMRRESGNLTISYAVMAAIVVCAAGCMAKAGCVIAAGHISSRTSNRQRQAARPRSAISSNP